jgi:hypothetical protein
MWFENYVMLQAQKTTLVPRWPSGCLHAKEAPIGHMFHGIHASILSYYEIKKNETVKP